MSPARRAAWLCSVARFSLCLLALAGLGPASARADAAIPADDPGADPAADPAGCSAMETYDVAMGMCMPRAMPGMRMLMLHGNAFLVGTTESGPRGREAVTAPDMLMADLGTTLGTRHYLNLDYMGTLEKWVYPRAGYPELLQVGETNAEGQPFIDAQHPHSSPIMGLTLSDTITLGASDGEGADILKLFAAPRGEATDGPVAFMHRPTGMVNPDAPLGHHIGQDVGHVTSTVLGASLKLGRMRYEVSTFYGREPLPTAVDLPIGAPDSFAVRIIREITPELTAMASFARVTQPEPDVPDIHFEDRISASVYYDHPLGESWTFHDMAVFGLVTNYDHATTLASFGEEFLWSGEHPRIWGRLELLQRTPGELAIATVGDPNLGLWVFAATLGYTHQLVDFGDAELDLGASGTKDLLPGALIGAYGGDPWSGKVFLQFGGMKMWEL